MKNNINKIAFVIALLCGCSSQADTWCPDGVVKCEPQCDNPFKRQCQQVCRCIEDVADAGSGGGK